MDAGVGSVTEMIRIRRLAKVNPPTPAFDQLGDGEPVTFMPLETVWAGKRCDVTRVRPKVEVATGYVRFQSGDILVPKVTPTFQAGRAAYLQGLRFSAGAASTEVHVVRVLPGLADPRYVRFGFLSKPFLNAGVSRFQGVAGLQRVPEDFIRDFEVAKRKIEDQCRIADFLDDQVARIDSIVGAREKQIRELDSIRLASSWDALTGRTVGSNRRDSGIGWLGSIPSSWPVATVNSAFEVVLGKMLDESRFTGTNAIPYLRNTNVQWDRIDYDDLKMMDIHANEYERFTVQPGDLLICEGGQPGRSAIWHGAVAPIGFQKALHRARPRGTNDVRWLQIFLRVAVGLSVFSAGFGQATIAHLTGEQLRSARLPVPPGEAQKDAADRIDKELDSVANAEASLSRSSSLAQELKRSLITAAVTGQFDVTTADGSQVPV